jgi:hypothetical protein
MSPNRSETAGTRGPWMPREKSAAGVEETGRFLAR